jgi:hypothetical protein
MELDEGGRSFTIALKTADQQVGFVYRRCSWRVQVCFGSTAAVPTTLAADPVYPR